MVKDKERRQFSRVIFQTKCHLTFGNKTLNGELIDISLKGALIKNAHPLTIKSGDPCQFDFALEGDGIVLNFDATLVYSQGRRLGIQFGSIDIEAMTHLRRLVELNICGANTIRNELFFINSE